MSFIIRQITQRKKNMYSAQRTKNKFRRFDKVILPHQIDPKAIFDAIKNCDQKPYQFIRKRGDQIFDKVESETQKIDILRITGKQVYGKSPVTRNKSQSKELKNMKQILNDPIIKIVAGLQHDPDIRHYQQELKQLQKLQLLPKKQYLSYSNPNIHNYEVRQQDLASIQQTKKNDQSLQQYEKMIINNPILYKKIMCAYNAEKRKIERDNVGIRRKSIQQKCPVSDLRTTLRRQTQNQIGKNPQQVKKNSLLQQFRQFQAAITLTSRLLVFPQQEGQYKAFICKGNNGLLVKSILKTRPWWSIRTHSEVDSCNLVWTEWKKLKVTNVLNKVKPNYIEKDNNQQIVGTKLTQKQINRKSNLMNKLIGQDNFIHKKLDKTVSNDQFFNFSSKINEKNFEEISQKTFKEEDIKYLTAGKDQKIHNHVPGCLSLHSKKLLFSNLKKYYEKINRDIFQVVPLTFQISKGTEDPEFILFVKYYEQIKNKNSGKNKSKGNVWILKPGQNSNRGNGISVMSSLSQIRSFVSQKCHGNRTVIIQKYMENPYLFNKRKFDIRCYILITTVNGSLKGYWFEDGYVRTTSKEFSLKNLENKLVHLTNDAVQKKGEQYGKFESCNKISFADFEKYVEANSSLQGLKFDNAYQKIKEISADLIRSVANKLNNERKQFTFEVFGLDYMLDDKLKPYLIEANSNPCLEVDGNVLARIIPTMIEQVIRVAIDPVFPPPYTQIHKFKFSPVNSFQNNKMVLVYDSNIEVGISKELYLQNQNEKDFEEEVQDMEPQIMQ